MLDFEKNRHAIRRRLTDEDVRLVYSIGGKFGEEGGWLVSFRNDPNFLISGSDWSRKVRETNLFLSKSCVTFNGLDILFDREALVIWIIDDRWI